MKELLILFILILVVYILLKKESFSTMPDIPMGLQWGSTPYNLYQLEDDNSQNNYFVKNISPILSESVFRDYKLSGNMGLGMAEINQKLGENNYAYNTNKIKYE